MAKYSWFAYSAQKYGSEPAQGKLYWQLQVDWDGNGVYSDCERQRIRDVKVRRGREEFIKADGSGFESVRVGEVRVKLDNWDGRYDPYNTGSPIYPYVRPGVRCKLRVRDVSTGVYHDVLRGFVADVQPMSGDDERVILTAYDGIEFLKQQEIHDAIYENITVYAAINYLLTAAGWTDAKSIEDNNDQMPYWWTMDKKAWEAITDLCNGYLGRAFVAADGTIKFYSRHHTGVSETTITQDEIMKYIDVPQPWEVVRNKIYVTAYPRRLYSVVEIWRLQDTVYVGPSESVEIWANYVYAGEYVPAINVITPVATTDYLMNTLSDGTGTNLTANFSVAISAFSATAKLTITNNGSQSGYITLLKLRGDALSSLNTVTILAEDAASQALYQIKTMQMEESLLQDANVAIDFANFLKGKLANPTAYPVIEILDRPSLQFSLDLFDTLTLTVAKKGINDDYDVSYIEHEFVGEAGQAVLTRIKLEVTEDLSGYWVFPTQIGVTSVFGY